jgi:hypothetical protein
MRPDAFNAAIEASRPRMGFAAVHSKSVHGFRGARDRRNLTLIDITILRRHCHLIPKDNRIFRQIGRCFGG